MKRDIKTSAILAAALRDLLDSLGPLRVFQGFPERSDQDVFCTNVRNSEDVLERLAAGTLGRT